MRLVTFLHNEDERWGVLVTDPTTTRDVVVEPGPAESTILGDVAVGTSGYHVSGLRFLGTPWPQTLVDFLALGDRGMASLDALVRFLNRAAAREDATVLDRAGHRIEDVELLAPIPRPRLLWGLVANAPSFVRNNLPISHVNLLPLGHQRPQGAVVGPGAAVLMRRGNHLPAMGYNVELGVIIGAGGRYIPLNEAMGHVAGYTTINDVSGTYYYGILEGNAGTGYHLPEGHRDWFFQATASWGGKMADTLCPMGPWLVTKDEVGNPYDLLVWTRQSGRPRDRAHTSAMIAGIERVIHWYSSFATLHPGDVIHFGTMGVDGLPIAAHTAENTAVTLEVEVEHVGRLANPLRVVPVDQKVDLQTHPSRAINQEASTGARLTPEDWRVSAVRHFYTSFGNHDKALDVEDLPRVAYPRFLNAPASSLGISGSCVELPPRASDLLVSIELAVVIGRLASEEGGAAAADAILGLTPLVSLCDLSFTQEVVAPVRLAERHIPAVYGRWADGFNVVAPQPVPLPRRWRARTMHVEAGKTTMTGSTSDYVAGPTELIETISAMITLFPGDVITLGSTAARIRIAALRSDDPPVRFQGRIDGIGEVAGEIVVSRPVTDQGSSA